MNNNMNNIPIFILSLLNKDRINIVKKNLELFPNLYVCKSINGYNKKDVIIQLLISRLNFYTLNSGRKTILKSIGMNMNMIQDYNFNTYGTLANFLTKFKMLLFQIENNIPFICFIEDDLQLLPDFVEFINNKTVAFNDPDLNMIRLDDWGEGYITSLNGAKRIVNNIIKNGIIQNIDNQLRENCGKESRVHDTPWKLRINSNNGDCLKTSYLTKNFSNIVLKYYHFIKKNNIKFHKKINIYNKNQLFQN